jgi:hypothetical protein
MSFLFIQLDQIFDLIKIKQVITSQFDQLITIMSIHKVTPSQNGHFTNKTNLSSQVEQLE